MIKELKNYIPKSVLVNKNRARTWIYGYNLKYDLVIISKTGQIGRVIEISNVRIGLPKAPKQIHKRHEKKYEQYWERRETPKQLDKIRSIFQWNEMPRDFKNRWVDYIEKEFEYRDEGYWFYNNGKPTYITGSHYMYLQWTKIDVGYPDFREANRALYLFWDCLLYTSPSPRDRG